jgi:predicted transcriptional regulator
MSAKSSCRKKRANESVPCSITIPKDLQLRLIAQAEKEDRSFSAVVRRAVASYLAPEAAAE